MLYSVMILSVMAPVMFVIGFLIGLKKGQNPRAPLITRKRTQTKYEQLSQNIANYVGNSDGQVPIKE